MSNSLVVHKARTNTVNVNLNDDVTGDTFTSEIRTGPNRDAALIATWVVVVDDAAAGELSLSLSDTVTGQIKQDVGYMDIKRVTAGGDVKAVFDNPIQVSFRGTVTE